MAVVSKLDEAKEFSRTISISGLVNLGKGVNEKSLANLYYRDTSDGGHSENDNLIAIWRDYKELWKYTMSLFGITPLHTVK